MRIVLWPQKPQVVHTTTARIDVTTVLYCSMCHTCMLRVDLDENKKCGMCHSEVDDVTSAPVGQAWLAFHHRTAQ
jgi:hypothetical protein